MTDTTKSGISRRTLAKGAAWAAPAVAVAAAAPNVAASPVTPPPCITAAFTGKPCRISNKKIYRFGFCITNACTDGASLTFTVTKLINQSGFLLSTTNNPFPMTVTLAPGQQFCVSERDWSTRSQGNGVGIWGYIGSTGVETLLWWLPAPQKVDSCDQKATTTTTTVAPGTTTATTTAQPQAKEEVTTTTTTVEVTTTTTTAAATTEAAPAETAGADA